MRGETAATARLEWMSRNMNDIRDVKVSFCECAKSLLSLNLALAHVESSPLGDRDTPFLQGGRWTRATNRQTAQAAWTDDSTLTMSCRRENISSWPYRYMPFTLHTTQLPALPRHPGFYFLVA